MIRKIALLCLCLLLPATSAQLQGVVDGTVGGITLNVRSQPDSGSTRIAQLPPHTVIVIDARSEHGDWVLVTAPELGLGGWVAIGYVSFDHPIRVMEDLPVSTAVINDAHAAASEGAAPVIQPSIIPDRLDYPTVYLDDAVWRNVHQIFARGQQLGNDPWVLMKVGESNTAGTVYLCNFEWQAYALGDHEELQRIVDEFSRTASFCRNNASAQNGFGTVNVLDPLFAPPELCPAGQSPLVCEVQRSRPSFALIYIGLADTGVMTTDEFNANLTRIVRYLSQNGVIPILQTWSTSDPLNSNNRPQLFNEEIRRVAHNNHVPMLDIRVGTYNFDNHGTMSDGYHLSVHNDQESNLGGDELMYGRTYREWQTLQILYDLTNGLGI